MIDATKLVKRHSQNFIKLVAKSINITVECCKLGNGETWKETNKNKQKKTTKQNNIQPKTHNLHTLDEIETQRVKKQNNTNKDKDT